MEVRDLRQGDWLWTHKAVLFSKHISPSDFKVYCGLASYAGNENQQSWPSMITLGTALNLSKSTVLRSLRVLELCGLVRIDRRDGTSNLYSLLKCEEVQTPEIKKADSTHHKLVQFFHVICQRTRGVKPLWSAKDTARLKKVIETGILNEDQIEELILYFLAAPQYRKFSPSMATFLSSSILNGLMNAMQNDRKFWKDLEGYMDRFTRDGRDVVPIEANSIQAMMKGLGEKMSVTSYGKQHD